ncbi:hypothetical protein [Kordia zhangzhouensis]|uniref:hypothetical protein n=1 Tax=Kordia zhangzhouensis TaxID=1620405 RepID=UPI0006292293|nr:hypothetical protein [Kordia zhangzhouensis]
MRFFFGGITFLFLTISCKTILINQESLILTETPVELGSIGLLRETLITNTYKNITSPSFYKKVKLNVQPFYFSKKTFKLFSKANKQEKMALNFSDSSKVKPEYVVLQFMDRLTITSALNNTKNTGLRSYLETKEDAQMVTSISVAFSQEHITQLKNASEVFLTQSDAKKFSLLLTFIDGKTQTLETSNGVVFGYQTSNFCWKEDSKHNLIIADIVSDAEGCPPNTHRKARKATQQKDYFKL